MKANRKWALGFGTLAITAGFYVAARGFRAPPSVSWSSTQVVDATPAVSVGLAGEWEYVTGEVRFTCNGNLETKPLAGNRFRLQKDGSGMQFSDDSCSYTVFGNDRYVEVKDGQCRPKQGDAADVKIERHTVASEDGQHGSVSVRLAVTFQAPKSAQPTVCQISGEGTVQRMGT
jgi:hypothetical protein